MLLLIPPVVLRVLRSKMLQDLEIPCRPARFAKQNVAGPGNPLSSCAFCEAKCCRTWKFENLQVGPATSGCAGRAGRRDGVNL